MPKKQPPKHKKRRNANQGRRIAIFAIIGGLALLLIAGGIAIYNANQPARPITADISQIPDTHDAHPDVPRIGIAEAKAKYDAGAAIFVDVRSLEEYQARHIPNAVSLPTEELAARIGELPKDAEIITYCT